MEMLASKTNKKLLRKCCLSPFEIALEHEDPGLCVRTLVEGGVSVNYRYMHGAVLKYYNSCTTKLY